MILRFISRHKVWLSTVALFAPLLFPIPAFASGISVDATAESQSTTALSITIGASNELLVFNVSQGASACTYDSVSATKLATAPATNGAYEGELWYLSNPSTGSHTISCGGGTYSIQATAYVSSGHTLSLGSPTSFDVHSARHTFSITPSATTWVVGAFGFGQNTVACEANCTWRSGSSQSSQNRGGIFDSNGDTASANFDISQASSDGMSGVMAEIDESGGGGGGGGSATQFYATIEGTGLSTVLRPTGALPLGAAYSCGSTGSTQTDCNSGYNWAVYAAGDDIGVGGQTVNGTYYFNVFNSSGGRPYDASKIIGYYVYTYTDGVWSTPSDGSTNLLTGTRFISLTPSTSTVGYLASVALGATGYIADSDYSSGDYLRLSYARNYDLQHTSVTDTSLLYITVDIPISASGYFSLSTTSSFSNLGAYTLRAEVRSTSALATILNFINIGGIFKDPTIKISTTTQFVVGHLSSFDTLVASTTASINTFISSSTVSLSSCNSFTGFNLIDCLNLLFVPNQTLNTQAITSFRDGFLSYAPWGYVTRFMVVLTGHATSTLPTLVVTIPAPLPGAGASLDLTPWSAITSATSPLQTVKSPDNHTLRQLVEPGYDDFVVFVFVLFVILELLGFGTGYIFDTSESFSSSDSTLWKNGKVQDIIHRESRNRTSRRRMSS